MSHYVLCLLLSDRQHSEIDDCLEDNRDDY